MSLSNDFFIDQLPGSVAPLNANRGNTAGGVYMAKLGDYMFAMETAAFQKLERTTQYRWAAQKRVGRLAAQQYTGIEDDKIELEGYILSTFRGGIGQMPLLRANAALGEPMPLVYAFETLGEYCGLWVIERITEGRTVFFRDGTPRRIDFAITLKAYGEDEDQEAIVSKLFTETIYGITPPPLARTESTAIINAGQTALGLPEITVDSSDNDTELAALSLVGSAQAAKDAINNVMARVRSALSSIASNGITLIPAEAVTAAADLATSASLIINTANQIIGTATAFKRNKVQVTITAAGMAADMSNYSRAISPAVATVKSAYAQLASAPTTGSGDADRLLAAGAIGNISRAADLLSFATVQSSEQASTVRSKFL